MDWSYPSNRFVVLATPVAGAIAGLVSLIRGDSLLDAVGWGFSSGGVAFLAWTIARELHPDRAWVAAVAFVIAPAGLAWGHPDLLASATVLLVARAVAGTTGLALRPADVVLLGAVGIPLVLRGSGPAALAIGAFGLALTRLWQDRRPGVLFGAVGLYAAGAVAALVLVDTPPGPDGTEWILVWVGLVAGLVGLLGPGPVTAHEDRRDGDGLRRIRVFAARVVALATAVAVAVTYEPAAMTPVWAALVATALRPR
jgi:hypothetical protein